MLRLGITVLLLSSVLVKADTDCTSLYSHEECSLEDACQWEDNQHRCINTGVADCTVHHHQDECEHAGCVYDLETSLCYDKGKGTPCMHILTSNACDERKECVWLEGGHMCIKEGEAICQYLFDETECSKNSECSYNTELSLCLKTGSKPDCKQIYDPVQCEKNGCILTSNHACINPGEKELCEQLYDQSACEALDHCEFVMDICHRKGLEISCGRILQKEQCDTQPHCVFREERMTCAKKGSSPQCDFFQERKECATEGDHCEWDEEVMICKKKGLKLGCHRFFEEEKCAARPGCVFRGYSCFDEAELKPCPEIESEVLCNALGCFYNFEKNECLDHDTHIASQPGMDEHDPAHVPGDETGGVPEGDMHPPPHLDVEPDCSDVSCSDEPKSCPDGELLAKPTFECCKRCGYPAQRCLTYFEREQCPEQCQWHEDGYFCNGFGATVPCDKHFDEDRCSKSGCDWHAEVFTCTPKGEPIPCEKFFDKEKCPTDRCKFHDSLYICWEKDLPVPCNRYFDEDSCTSGNECSWDQHAMTCTNAGEILPCDRYYTDAGCNTRSDACVWLDHASRCHVKGEAIPCEYLGKDECGAHEGCGWNTHGESCIEIFDFEPLPCHDHFEMETCQEESGCQWSEAGMTCLKEGEKLSCDQIFVEEHCNTHCNWYGDLNRCMGLNEKPTCDMFFDEQMCVSHSCKWEESVFVCIAPGEKIPCDRYYDDTQCKAHGCTWAEGVQMCHESGTLIPCDRLYMKKECEDRADCIFSEQSMMCSSKDDPNAHVDCQMMDKTSCKSQPKCVWHDNIPAHIGQGKGACGQKGQSPCGMINDQSQCDPKTIPGCAFDKRSYRCRALRGAFSDEL
eukprot:m.13472 g.13472  ORF g.13472 m.13472 type:complete len:853 (+) comp4863_c0_seq1:77-2635(+)